MSSKRKKSSSRTSALGAQSSQKRSVAHPDVSEEAALESQRRSADERSSDNERPVDKKLPASMPEPSPLGQSPDNPIVFTSGDEVARGNMERANAEPEPQALHAAKVPGVPDPAVKRRHEEAEIADDDTKREQKATPATRDEIEDAKRDS